MKDTVRDVRGFAMKFYTPEGIWDLVGNDIPVFFIQDAVKFPDFVHALKPEPHNEVPQGQTAHNNFWDFVGLMPECLWGFFFLCAASLKTNICQPPIWFVGSCPTAVRLIRYSSLRKLIRN